LIKKNNWESIADTKDGFPYQRLMDINQDLSNKSQYLAQFVKLRNTVDEKVD